MIVNKLIVYTFVYLNLFIATLFHSICNDNGS